MVAPWLLTRVVVVAALAFGISGCSQGSADIQDAFVSPDGRTLELIVGACNADLTAVVDESGDTVEITVTAKNENRGADCAGGIQVSLDSELGDRSVIDGSNGQEVNVQLDATLGDNG